MIRTSSMSRHCIYLSAAIIGGWMLAMPAHAEGLFFHRKASSPDPALQPPGLEYVGQLIDQLDRELFRLGMIDVKAPDVWGQNRMTKYRAEFESQMAQELGKFTEILNAAQRRADLAVLVSSTAVGVSAGAGGSPSGSAAASGATTKVSATSATTPAATSTAAKNASSSGAGTTPTSTTSSSPPEAPDTTAQLTYLSQRLDKLETDTNLLKLPTDLKIGLEPTVHLDEEANYINHLHRLRRINAGDDLTDTQGYGLYLIRVPISLLPGPEVRKGKGAVVSFEARHILPPDLLANTFRSVVVMDAAYQLNPLLLKLLHSKSPISPEPCQCLPQPAGAGAKPGVSSGGRSQPKFEVNAPISGNVSPVSSMVSMSESNELYGPEIVNVLLNAIQKDRADWYTHDPSILSWMLTELATAHRFMREQARNGTLADLFQPGRFMELDQMIQQRNYSQLAVWRCNFLKELVLRRNGRPFLANQLLPPDDLVWISQQLNVTDALVYALMVQSVLVDRQLKHDIGIVSQRKGCVCGDLNVLTFYDLIPTLEAQQAFNMYVDCKWPLHVFSLDPAVDQQNQLDLFSARSELQIALAVAVASGKVNIRQATSYARQLQLDTETISLNRTAVGFGAGETTFGWRFYPRIQTPPTQGGFQRFGGVLFGSNYGETYLLKNRQIEPGVRECVALVVAPNFVPAIRLTSAANWFDISGHPHHMDQKLDTSDVLRLSRMVQSARNTLAAACDAGHYRPGEAERLSDRLAQLESQLPLQDYRVPLPFEGDLTGSEIFTSEDTQLNPRLLGWYGEPPKEGTASAIYLLGTNFSVHEFDVIAGGVSATEVKLMSRNVMKITISDKARSKQTNDGRAIFDVHTASPNGISNHLFVEVDRPAPAVKADPAPAKTVTTTITTTTSAVKDGTTSTTQITTTPPGIVLPQGTILPLAPLPSHFTIAPQGGPVLSGTVPQANAATSGGGTPAPAVAPPAHLAPPSPAQGLESAPAPPSIQALPSDAPPPESSSNGGRPATGVSSTGTSRPAIVGADRGLRDPALLRTAVSTPGARSQSPARSSKVSLLGRAVRVTPTGPTASVAR